MKKIRQDYEMPEAIEKWGWKYHHLGVPTLVKMKTSKKVGKLSNLLILVLINFLIYLLYSKNSLLY